MKFHCSYSGEVDIVFYSPIEGILHRPGMYTLNGTFAEAIAYLEGMYGRYTHQDVWLEKNGYPVPDENKEWRNFREWLELGSERYFAVLQRIQAEHGNGQDACQTLLALFHEFKGATES